MARKSRYLGYMKELQKISKHEKLYINIQGDFYERKIFI